MGPQHKNKYSCEGLGLACSLTFYYIENTVNTNSALASFIYSLEKLQHSGKMYKMWSSIWESNTIYRTSNLLNSIQTSSSVVGSSQIGIRSKFVQFDSKICDLIDSKGQQIFEKLDEH